jgi:hypothetical protein
MTKLIFSTLVQFLEEYSSNFGEGASSGLDKGDFPVPEKIEIFENFLKIRVFVSITQNNDQIG